jgi:hypothetical protein
VTDNEPATAEVRLIKRAPAAVARILFETVKDAIDECDPWARFELIQEVADYVVARAGRDPLNSVMSPRPESLTDPDGQQIPFADVVWTPPDSTGVAVPDWVETARRRAELERADV